MRPRKLVAAASACLLIALAWCTSRLHLPASGPSAVVTSNSPIRQQSRESALATRIEPSLRPGYRILLSNGPNLEPAAGASFLYRLEGKLESHVSVEADLDGLVTLAGEGRPREYMAWHRYGARSRTSEHSDNSVSGPVAITEIVLGSAGAVIVSARGIRGPFTVRVEPLAKSREESGWDAVDAASGSDY
jgi:hypothetical protein